MTTNYSIIDIFQSSEVDGNEDDNAGEETTNEWTKLKDSGSASADSPAVLAMAELDLYESFNVAKYLPVMEPLRVLGAIDSNGNPQKLRYELGPVKKRGLNLKKAGKNHADYVDKDGRYDTVKYLLDMQKKIPSISNVGIGQYAPHITTEVDCESLFSQAGLLVEARQSRTDICMYERLVVGKHWLSRIHCSIARVKELFFKRWKENDWDEQDNIDDTEFFEAKKYPEGNVSDLC